MQVLRKANSRVW